MKVPLRLIEWVASKGFWSRPKFLGVDTDEIPDVVGSEYIHRECRGRFPKWAHFQCPRCKETISIPLTGKRAWSMRIDFLRRPTLHPSIWQTGSCGAHFFVRHGNIEWCQ